MTDLRVIDNENAPEEQLNHLSAKLAAAYQVALVAAHYASGGAEVEVTSIYTSPEMQEIQRLAEAGIAITPRLVGEVFARIRTRK